MNKSVVKVWTFRSESNPKKTHETLLYDDGSTSCGCMAWTRRPSADGSRTCRHVRYVAQGIADEMAYKSSSVGKKVTVSVTIEDNTRVGPRTSVRRVSFDD